MSHEKNCTCKYSEYWNNRAYERHRDKVNQVTPTVNMAPPVNRPHVLYNARKSRLERERQTQILRENFILLRKLREIMHGKSKYRYPVTRETSKCIRTR